MDAGHPVKAQGEATVQQEIRAKKIVLVDEQGKTRAMLTLGNYGPLLSLMDENEPRAIRL